MPSAPSIASVSSAPGAGLSREVHAHEAQKAHTHDAPPHGAGAAHGHGGYHHGAHHSHGGHHDHGRIGARPAPVRIGPSILRLSALTRLALALALIVPLWAIVLLVVG